MRRITGRSLCLPLAAALLLAAPAPPTRAENVFDTIKEKVLEVIRKETEKDQAPDESAGKDTSAAPAPSGSGGLNKVLVWGDPANAIYYREGHPLYGKADGGRCMSEKQAKQSGLQAAQRPVTGDQGQAAAEDNF